MSGDKNFDENGNLREFIDDGSYVWGVKKGFRVGFTKRDELKYEDVNNNRFVLLPAESLINGDVLLYLGGSLNWTSENGNLVVSEKEINQIVENVVAAYDVRSKKVEFKYPR